jgi:hypothetical protein
MGHVTKILTYMKAINILTHTYTIIASFLIILISGENFGGFYLLYLLMALPHGGVHALLALFGIAVMIIAKNYFRERKNPLLIGTLNILEFCCFYFRFFSFSIMIRENITMELFMI